MSECVHEGGEWVCTPPVPHFHAHIKSKIYQQSPDAGLMPGNFQYITQHSSTVVF